MTKKERTPEMVKKNSEMLVKTTEDSKHHDNGEVECRKNNYKYRR